MLTLTPINIIRWTRDAADARRSADANRQKAARGEGDVELHARWAIADERRAAEFDARVAKGATVLRDPHPLPRDAGAPLHVRRARKMARALVRLHAWMQRTLARIADDAAAGDPWAVDFCEFDTADAYTRRMPYHDGYFPIVMGEQDVSIWPSVRNAEDAAKLGAFQRGCRELADQIAEREGRPVKRRAMGYSGSVSRGVYVLAETCSASG